MSNKPVVRVIGTGGTIATVTDNRMDFTNYPGRRDDASPSKNPWREYRKRASSPTCAART